MSTKKAANSPAKTKPKKADKSAKKSADGRGRRTQLFLDNSQVEEKIFYDKRAGNYWLKMSETSFLQMSASDIKDHCRMAGVNTDIEDENGLPVGNRILVNSRTHRAIDYAGPLGGHKAGILDTDDGKKILITEPTRVIAPNEKTSCDWILDYLAALLRQDDSSESLDRALIWMKLSYESLVRGDFKPSPMLAVCGPAQSGKSFLAELLTRLLGGRAAHPYLYMVGKTPFNEDLAQAEVLIMDDDGLSKDSRSRDNFADSIKKFVVNPAMHVHPKNKKGFSIQTFRRLVGFFNHEPEKMLIIPPMDNDIAGKIQLHHSASALAVLFEDRTRNIQRLKDELPGFISFLLKLKVPKKYHDHRFGAAAFHDAELMEILSGLAPESSLLAMIETHFADSELEFWSGAAGELQSDLERNADTASNARRLLCFNSSCGTYLSRLEAKFPERFKSSRSNGKTKWTIKNPAGES